MEKIVLIGKAVVAGAGLGLALLGAVSFFTPITVILYELTPIVTAGVAGLIVTFYG